MTRLRTKNVSLKRGVILCPFFDRVECDHLDGENLDIVLACRGPTPLSRSNNRGSGRNTRHLYEGDHASGVAGQLEAALLKLKSPERTSKWLHEVSARLLNKKRYSDRSEKRYGRHINLRRIPKLADEVLYRRRVRTVADGVEPIGCIAIQPIL